VSADEDLTMPKILVVDDAASIRAEVANLLEGAGFSMVLAQDGFEALARLETVADIDLVILDLNMPGKDGLDVLEEMRGAGKALPVLMLTSEDRADLLSRARRGGARGWVRWIQDGYGIFFVCFDCCVGFGCEPCSSHAHARWHGPEDPVAQGRRTGAGGAHGAGALPGAEGRSRAARAAG
jgi:CheY-like chemotaxis protein